MSATRQTVQTPRAMRNLALLAMVLSSFAGIFAAADTLSLGNLQRNPEQLREAATKLPFVADPDMVVATAEAQISVLEGMKGSRGFVLSTFAVVCVVIFTSARWLLVANALPREGARRVLSTSLLFAAVLRTVDGAQSAAIVQKVNKAVAPVLAQEAGGDAVTAALLRNVLPTLTLGTSIAFTAIMAGGFLLLAQYFRSERVRKVVAAHDQSVDRPE